MSPLLRPLDPRSAEPANTVEVVEEREALEELLQSAGWLVFLSYAAREWDGRGYRSRMKAALASGDPLAPRVTDRTADEIFRLLNWPSHQVLELKGIDAE